jgi:hypothetical protein
MFGTCRNEWQRRRASASYKCLIVSQMSLFESNQSSRYKAAVTIVINSRTKFSAGLKISKLLDLRFEMR